MRIGIGIYRELAPRSGLMNTKVVDDQTLLRHWRKGLDTYAIALQVGIPEYEVHNRLPGIRARDRSNAEWNFDALHERRPA
jgi:hypothetical protein